ncbi:MAG: Ku protein [Candidatus Lokiarchaeota archaeon]|nr:Ku protein [Candidatus Lokiarchaeota archaeon]MBD3339709.1 Ku protein [Candidatus Lokiarchaeota archaeon]
MKAVWKGYIGFGLVNIPISLYSAVEQNKFSFRLLHEKDHGKIHYKRVCSKCGKEVDWDDIVKGLKVGKGNYYVLTKKELDQLKPTSGDLIEIQEFVSEDQLDMIFLDKHYFIGPSKGNKRSYYLFKEILKTQKKIAIATFVMRENEYYCSIKSFKEGMLLSLLNYDNDVRDISSVDYLGEKPEFKEQEISLAQQLVKKLTKESFDPSKYKDTFEEKLKEKIRKKMEGEMVTIEEEKVEGTENLIESLKASVKK